MSHQIICSYRGDVGVRGEAIGQETSGRPIRGVCWGGWGDRLLALMSLSQIIPVVPKFRASGLFAEGYLKPTRGKKTVGGVVGAVAPKVGHTSCALQLTSHLFSTMPCTTLSVVETQWRYSVCCLLETHGMRKWCIKWNLLLDFKDNYS